MRKDTTTLIPELGIEQQDTLNNLIKLGETNSKIQVINDQKQRAHASLSGISDEYQLILDKLAARGIDSKKVKALKDDMIEELFMKEDGTSIGFSLPSTNAKQLLAAKRDFVEMILNSSEATTKLDVALAELEKMNAEFNEEVKAAYEETNGDVTSHATKYLHEQLATLDRESAQAIGIKHVLASLDDAVDLYSLFYTYSDLNPRNTLNDFMTNAERYVKKFNKLSSTNMLSLSFTPFDYLEVLFLDKRHHTYRNLFIFLVVKKYAMKKTWTRVDAIFLTQFVVNLQTLLYDPKRNKVELTGEKKEKQNRFLSGINRVMDLFNSEVEEIQLQEKDMEVYKDAILTDVDADAYDFNQLNERDRYGIDVTNVIRKTFGVHHSREYEVFFGNDVHDTPTTLRAYLSVSPGIKPNKRSIIELFSTTQVSESIDPKPAVCK